MKTLEEIKAERDYLDQEERAVKEASNTAYKEAVKGWDPEYDWSVRDPKALHLPVQPMDDHSDDRVCFMALLSQKSRVEIADFVAEFGRSPMQRQEGFSSVTYGWEPVPKTDPNDTDQMGVVYHVGGGTRVLYRPDKRGILSNPTIFCTRAQWAAVRALEITPPEFNKSIELNMHLR